MILPRFNKGRVEARSRVEAGNTNAIPFVEKNKAFISTLRPAILAKQRRRSREDLRIVSVRSVECPEYGLMCPVCYSYTTDVYTAFEVGEVEGRPGCCECDVLLMPCLVDPKTGKASFKGSGMVLRGSMEGSRTVSGGSVEVSGTVSGGSVGVSGTVSGGSVGGSGTVSGGSAEGLMRVCRRCLLEVKGPSYALRCALNESLMRRNCSFVRGRAARQGP